MIIPQNQRREHNRLSISLPVAVERFNMKNYNEPIEGQTINMSNGGMCLLTVSEDIGINEKVTLSFDIGDIETVEGVVLRTETADDGIYRHKISVQFAFKMPQQKQRLYKFLEERQLREGGNA